ncbi:MAG: ABC transporter ATP-binding protein [Gammaproteobacteria bacterium]
MTGLYVKLKNTLGIPLDLEFECDPGKVLALVGPSGSGKTTALRCIAGLFKTDQGLIRCKENVWFDQKKKITVSPQKRHVGMVFQNYALFPHLSVKKNIELSIEKNDASNVEELLSAVNLQGLDDRLPKTLSGGQQQRVALARALARKPDVLLLDEPFSAVDQVTRRKLRLELLELIRRLNIPIILVTHDLDEAAMLADNLCVIHNGKGLQIGSPDEVFNTPKNALVARLMDVRNIFTGNLIDQNQEENNSLIEWAGIKFNAPYQQDFSSIDKINWCISADKVLLHRRVNPSNGVRENPVSGQIVELVKISGVSNVIIAIDSHPELKLHMDLPPHVVERNQLKIGEEISMSLLKDSIHLMAV